MTDISEEDINKTYEKLKREAESAGYNLNSDVAFTKDLIRGLLVNEIRYGYWACPCRLASGKKKEDIDIICPCDYRDPDLTEYDSCYCALYVSQVVINGKNEVNSVPERRPSLEDRMKKKESSSEISTSLSKPVWRCCVCGYLCGRDDPPEICPICKVKKDRFERFIG
jgi:ferredoxin-thioredoxin reductase catalytic subunit